MVSKKDSNTARLQRHKRVRAKISGTAERPRLDVFRSAKNIYAQVIDDVAGVTLVSASTAEKSFTEYGGNKEAAKKIGQIVAERMVVCCCISPCTWGDYSFSCGQESVVHERALEAPAKPFEPEEEPKEKEEQP